VSLKWAVLVSVSLVSACSVFAPKGPSVVARGEYYSAGKPEYDAFFIELHDKQVELLSAPVEPQTARRNLAQAVGLTADASNDSLKERLGHELGKLAGQGLRVRLEVPPASSELDASATLHTEGSTSTPLRNLLPQEATRLARSRNRMLGAKAALDKLRITGITLDTNIDQAFRTDGPWKRDEVRKNLSDGQKVITIMQSRAQEIATTDTQLLAMLSNVASTGPSLGKGTPAASPTATAEEERKPARRSGSHGAPAAQPRATPPEPRSAAPAKTAPGPTPPPKASPKRGDDDAGRPKPTRGNAPAEIEP
jgi:hypothetical protein